MPSSRHPKTHGEPRAAPAKGNSLRIEVPLNRVEGDLEVTADITDGVVVDAWASGTLYRGFENMLVGRDALDGLAITPRVCGMCNTAHQTAAVLALESVIQASLPPDAVRLRNLTLMAEHLQNDVRQSFLMYTADFTNPAHADLSLHEEAVQRYLPFRGQTVAQVVAQSKHLLEIIAIFGGQWPHSSFMVPGGVVSIPNAGDLIQAQVLLTGYRRWYEERILGCSIERWASVSNQKDLDQWLDESPAHRESDLGFFLRFCQAAGLDRLGVGHNNFLCYGYLDMPAGTAARSPGGERQLVPAGVAMEHLGATADGRLVPAGVARGTRFARFDPGQVSEQVVHSWYTDSEPSRHPSQGLTQPYASGWEGARYSWVKAPRYEGLPFETGPLAEAVIARNPLFLDLVSRGGASAMVRQLARIVRTADLLPAMQIWLREIVPGGDLYIKPGEIEQGEGCGLTEAARGALGHWMRVANGRIAHYQIITPTTWHGSPRDSAGVRGPFEQALLGTPVRDPENPVELGHVVRSFDPCLVCSVHLVEGGVRRGAVRMTL